MTAENAKNTDREPRNTRNTRKAETFQKWLGSMYCTSETRRKLRMIFRSLFVPWFEVFRYRETVKTKTAERSMVGPYTQLKLKLGVNERGFC